MKRNIVLLCTAMTFVASTASADALKSSLTNMMHKKDATPGMVDLSALSVNGKPKPMMQTKKAATRSSKAVVATVNGRKVIKKEADAYLSKRTNGQVKNFDLLPNKQRIRLIQEMSVADVAADIANKELTEQEKTAILTRVWMQKEASKIKVTDAQVKETYDNLKKRAMASKSPQAVPEFDKIKNQMKMQMTEKMIVDKLLSKADIKVINANMIAGSINDSYISIEDANAALQSISKGKAKWENLSDRDRENLMKMIAPNKLIEAAVKTDLTTKEKNIAFSNFWMQNTIRKTKVSDKELKAAYNKIKKSSKKAKSKQKLPPFEQLKPTLQMQIAKERVIADLMKNAKIKLK